MNKKILSAVLIFLAVLSFSACKKAETNYEIEIKIPGLTRDYNYYLVNDMHIFIGDDEINPDYNELVVSRINEFSLDGNASSQNLDKWLSGVGKGYDGMILNADILDQLSSANITHLGNVLKRVKVPYMYLQSDHDLATDWTILSDKDRDLIENVSDEMGFGKPYYTFEEESFIIVGINNSWRSISEETFKELKALFDKGKAIILITHVPYDSIVSDEIREKSKELKGGRVLVWGMGAENYYYPNESMRDFLNMVYADDSPVVAVIGAHLHTELTTMLTDKIPEYITDTGYSGTRTNIHIVAK